jgi:8-oxo-dGTP diphosphatase
MNTENSAFNLAALWVDKNLPYLPRPNTVEVVATSILAPRELTTTAFVLAFEQNRTIILARNQRRGIEIPGGHLEPGESAKDAAIREAYEETGCVIECPEPIGFLRMTTRGKIPSTYRYPYPIAFQQFFAAFVVQRDSFVPNDECGKPLLVSDLRSDKYQVLTRKSHRIFYRIAYQRLFPF